MKTTPQAIATSRVPMANSKYISNNEWKTLFAQKWRRYYNRLHKVVSRAKISGDQTRSAQAQAALQLLGTKQSYIDSNLARIKAERKAKRMSTPPPPPPVSTSKKGEKPPADLQVIVPQQTTPMPEAATIAFLQPTPEQGKDHTKKGKSSL